MSGCEGFPRSQEFRPHLQGVLNMWTELVPETSENLHILTRLSAQVIVTDVHQMLAYHQHAGYLLASDERILCM